MSTPAARDRRSFRLLAWAAVPVLALAGYVQVTGIGIDILVLAVAGLILFALERSVGDLLGEWFGPLASALILVVAVVALSWYFLADSLGRPRTDRFFAEAERRGYRTLYYQTVRERGHTTPPSPDSATVAEPVATRGGSTKSSSSPARQVRNPDAGASPSRVAETPAPAVPPPAVAVRESNDPGATRASRPFFRRGSTAEPAATSISITISPSPLEVARRAVITARVVSGGVRVASGTVEFMVNGLGAGRAPLNDEGVASTTFQTYIAGAYEVRARYAGSAEYATSTARASFNVVARRP